MAQLKKAKVEVNAKDLTATWNWADETETKVDMQDFATEIMDQAMLHGLKQKLSDSYAGAGTVREAKEAFENVLKALLAGSWNAGRSSSGGLWVEALAKAANVSVEEALAKWNELDEEAQKDLKKNPLIKQAKAEIDLERAKLKAEGTVIDIAGL